MGVTVRKLEKNRIFLFFVCIWTHVKKNYFCRTIKNIFFSSHTEVFWKTLTQDLGKFHKFLWALPWENLLHAFTVKQCFKNHIFDPRKNFLPFDAWEGVKRKLFISFRMVEASSIWAFWDHYCRERKFNHSLEAPPFQIFD